MKLKTDKEIILEKATEIWLEAGEPRGEEVKRLRREVITPALNAMGFKGSYKHQVLWLWVREPERGVIDPVSKVSGSCV